MTLTPADKILSIFRKNRPAERVIAFIEENFDLSAKTGGLV